MLRLASISLKKITNVPSVKLFVALGLDAKLLYLLVIDPRILEESSGKATLRTCFRTPLSKWEPGVIVFIPVPSISLDICLPSCFSDSSTQLYDLEKEVPQAENRCLLKGNSPLTQCSIQVRPKDRIVLRPADLP